MRKNLSGEFGLAALVGALLIAGCGTNESASETDVAADDGPRSIFADDPALAGNGSPDPATLPPLETTLSFADGTPELTEAVRAELATILASPQIKAGGRIVLRGHTDSEGADANNLETSRAMAEAVSAFMVEGGVAAERIELIAFGEQNPSAPNALPDGSPNQEGRALNRRVEVTVETGRSSAREQTLVETLTEGAAADAAQGPAAQQPQ